MLHLVSLIGRSLFIQQFMSLRHNFNTILLVFWVQETNPYPNQTLILTLILFQFKVEPPILHLNISFSLSNKYADFKIILQIQFF